MGYLQSFGAKGQEIANLTWALLILSIVVVVITSALVLVGIFLRKSSWRAGEGHREPIVRRSGGVAWITIGVSISTVALIGSMGWTAYTMAAIRRPGTEPALTVEVIGHQWWWQVRYQDPDTSRVFETANEIHVPVGRPVRFKVTTADVIHSFWVPAIGDKIDLIPNQTNETWLQADRPGLYRGQCSEYCGQQHAHMALVLVAQNDNDFAAWWNGQLKSAPVAGNEIVAAAEDRFVLRCGACHSVRGTRAGGHLGPDLSHLMSRHSLAAGTLPNTIAYLSGWIANPQTVKPGNLMPTLDISGTELASIRTYLETLK